MAMEWKELDFFGESKIVPYCIFQGGEAILDSNSYLDWREDEVHAVGYLGTGYDMTQFPNYQHIKQSDLVTDHFYIKIESEQQQEYIKIEPVLDYRADVGKLSIGFRIFIPKEASDHVIKITLSSITIYALYDVGTKEITISE